mgnify:FL=1
MKVLVVGGGGRDHAVWWAIAAAPLCEALYCAPGNAGIAKEATCVPIPAEDVEGLLAFARAEAIDFVVVGPEAPLVAGLIDRLSDAGIKAFGPSAAAAELEGSKGFMKDLCAANGIPTARYRRFTEPEAAKAFARELGAPVVVKADGLAAGKGVTVCPDLETAEGAIDEALVGGRFGAAGAEVVVEDFLDGEEVSFFALVDGTTALPLASAQDHKAAFDGDRGPNTGGMGAYSPAPIVTPELEARIMAEIVGPTAEALQAMGRPYRGVLFAGLMISPEGDPKVVEFNVRFGDPECEVLVTRLMSDLLPALVATAEGQLSHLTLRWLDSAAISVVVATKGYPGAYEKDSVIRGLDTAGADENVEIFHAGTASNEAGETLATGGRVLAVTATAPSLAEAQTKAYTAIDLLDWPEGFCRRDIGWRALGG